VSRWLRREHRLKTLPETVPRRLALLWYQHRRLRDGGDRIAAVATFPGYLAGRWGLDSVWNFLSFASAELAQRRARRGRR
jgi:hypothetical protein